MTTYNEDDDNKIPADRTEKYENGFASNNKVKRETMKCSHRYTRIDM